MGRPVRRTDRQAGFSLVEVLLAISILGVGVVTLVGGMMTSIHVSDLGRRQAEGQTAVREYAEAVAGDTYVPCNNPTLQYPSSGFTPPADFTTPPPPMTVEVWSAATSNFETCGGPYPDTGLQRVTLRLTTSDGRGDETLRIAKRS